MAFVLTLIGLISLYDQKESRDIPKINFYMEAFYVLCPSAVFFFIFSCSGSYIFRVHGLGLEALVKGVLLKFIVTLGQYLCILGFIWPSLIFLSSYLGLDYALVDFLTIIIFLGVVGILWPQFVKHILEQVPINERKKSEEHSNLLDAHNLEPQKSGTF